MKQTIGFLFIIILLLLYTVLSIDLVEEAKEARAAHQRISVSVQPEDFNLSSNSYMYDAHGQMFEEIIGEQNRQLLPFEEIPQVVKDAFIATEDQYFFDHKGFDLTGIARSFLVNMKHNEMEQGGSTITQQLIRNLYLSNEKTVNRKMKELLLAFQLEKELSKEQILEMYVNAIYFQNGMYGIEAASQFYFSRPAHQLTLAEAAFLSAIPNNPTYYDPLKHIEHTIERQKWVLNRMLELELITPNQHQEALQQPIQLRVRQPVHRFPDYSTYVYHEFSQLIAEQEKLSQEKLQERVYELLYVKGVKIHTALQPSIQTKAKDSLRRNIPQAGIEGAITIINHQNHQLVAMIGGKNIEAHGFNRAFQSYRQPGSTIKPILVYGPYLDKLGGSMTDSINAANFCKNGYCPQNYGGKKYGKVSLETALKYSLNTAAVRLLDQLGVKTGFSYLEKFHFSKISEKDQRLTTALGGFTYGVTPLELTSAYTTFGNQGSFTLPSAITKVTDLEGNLLYQQTPQAEQVWSVDTNNKMRQLLTKVVTEGTATAARFPAPYLGGKTGTTDEIRDLWFIGLDDQYTTGVWVGYDRPRSLAAIEKKRPHLLVWKDIMMSLSQ